MKIQFTPLFFVLISTVACSGGGAGGGDDDNPFIDWSPYHVQDEAITSSAWGAPEVIGASTPGWEEGVYISPDGNTLYYIYTNVDIFRLLNTGEEKISGPNLDPAGTGMSWVTGAGRDCGVYPYADHFYVTKTGQNSWSAPQPHFLTTTRMESIGGIHIIENSTRRIAYFMSGFGDGVDSLFAAFDDGKDGWESVPVDVGFTFDAYLFDQGFFSDNQDHEHADPWVNDAGTLMFFWSDREGDGDKDIYYSTNPNGIDSDSWDSPLWTAPVNLPSPINTDGDDIQTFVFTEPDGDYLYYSTNRGHDDPGMSYEIAIYRSKMPPAWESTPAALETSGNWGTPERIIHSDLAVGEPTITADGQYLYFEQIFHDGNGNFNPDMMRVKRN